MSVPRMVYILYPLKTVSPPPPPPDKEGTHMYMQPLSQYSKTRLQGTPLHPRKSVPT